MVLLPLEDLGNALSAVGLVASDVDGTLTLHEKFTPELLKAIAQLQQAHIPLLLVTGRSAGWVDALRYYLPVTGAIAENGGLYYPAAGAYQLLSDIPDLEIHRQKLRSAFEMLKQQYPQLQESSDNTFRLTDWTFDVEGLSQVELGAIATQCQDWGWSFTYSTVQCHIKPADQSKANGIQQVLRQQFPNVSLNQVVTLGDSPNDETMFDPDIFPVSVGVANILNYRDLIQHLPQFVTTQPGADGFCELVALLSKPR
jgi:HAD superfamily hydrolase (TIGR01484 family)